MINVNKWTKGAKRTYQHIHIPLCEHACVCMHTHAQTERDRDTEKISKSTSEPKSVKNTNPSCSLTLPEIWACAMSTALRTVSNTHRGLRKQLLKVSCVYFACTFEDLSSENFYHTGEKSSCRLSSQFTESKGLQHPDGSQNDWSGVPCRELNLEHILLAVISNFYW